MAGANIYVNSGFDGQINDRDVAQNTADIVYENTPPVRAKAGHRYKAPGQDSRAPGQESGAPGQESRSLYENEMSPPSSHGIARGNDVQASVTSQGYVRMRSGQLGVTSGTHAQQGPVYGNDDAPPGSNDIVSPEFVDVTLHTDPSENQSECTERHYEGLNNNDSVALPLPAKGTSSTSSVVSVRSLKSSADQEVCPWFTRRVLLVILAVSVVVALLFASGLGWYLGYSAGSRDVKQSTTHIPTTLMLETSTEPPFTTTTTTATTETTHPPSPTTILTTQDTGDFNLTTTGDFNHTTAGDFNTTINGTNV